MKKLFYILSICTLVLTSCSSSDDDNNVVADPITGTLLKKLVENDSDGTSVTIDFVYNGNKMTSFLDTDGDGATITYTGDLVTKIEYYFENTMDQKDLYTYNTLGQLITYVRLDLEMEWGNREDYTYNNNNTITVVSYNGDLVSQTQNENTHTITMNNGEVSTIIDGDGNSRTYTYDNKYNPLKNITGFGKIAFVAGEANGIVRNVVLETQDVFGFSSTISNTYTYNTAGFPTTSSENYDGEVTTYEYFY